MFVKVESRVFQGESLNQRSQRLEASSRSRGESKGLPCFAGIILRDDRTVAWAGLGGPITIFGCLFKNYIEVKGNRTLEHFQTYPVTPCPDTRAQGLRFWVILSLLQWEY